MIALVATTLRRIPLFLLFLTVVEPSPASIGVADWSSTTPGGNSIEYNDGKRLILERDTRFEDIDEWYFYHDCIVVKIDVGKYLVVDEKGRTHQLFDSYDAWQQYIKSHDLEPALWTRWYSDDWESGTLLIAQLSAIIWMPLMVFYFRTAYRAFRLEKFSLRKKNTLVTLISTVVILYAVFLVLCEVYPQSF